MWDNTYQTTLKPIVSVQKRAIRIMTFSKPDEHSGPLLKQLEILKLKDLVYFYNALFMYKHELWESLYSYILIKSSPYQLLCYIMSLIAPYCSIKSPIFAVFINISPCFFGFRSRSVSYIYTPNGKTAEPAAFAARL